MRIWHLSVLCFAAACAAAVSCIAAPETTPAANANDSVNLELKDVEVKSAIEALFRNTGKNFSIDQNVQGHIPALSIKNVPFDMALRSITKSAGLVYRVDGGIYIISKKPEANATAAISTPVVDAGVLDTPTTEPEIRIEKISLNNVSASEILSVLTGQDRMYGGYGLGSGYGGYGYAGNYGYGGGRYGSGNYGGYGINFQGGYGGYRGYGGYGGYNGGGYRSYGYGGSGYGGYGGFGRGW